MTVRKAERLLNLIVMLLETPRPATAKEIQETIPGYDQENNESFKRMFERDKEELRGMGIPLELVPTDAWEIEQGYQIPKNRYYLPDLALEPDELTALWLASGLAGGAAAGARTALLKLSGEFAPEEAGQPPPWLSADMALSSPGLEVAFEAVSERRRLIFDYHSRPRTLDPYGLAFRRGAWYLTGLDHGQGDVRSFRLDRMTSGPRIETPTGRGPEFEVPSEFRAGASLERPPFASGGPDSITARVRFEPSVAWWVQRSERWVEVRRFEDGHGEAELEVSDIDAFVGWVAGFGEEAVVESPDEIRRRMRSHLEEILA